MDVVNRLRRQWDRFGAWVCIGIGALALLFGWIGMSGTAYPAEQLPYILSGGIAGVFFLGLGAMLWLSADLRDEWCKLDRIEARLAAGARLDDPGGIVRDGELRPDPGPADGKGAADSSGPARRVVSWVGQAQ